MKEWQPPDAGQYENERSRLRWVWLLLSVGLFILFVGIFLPLPGNEPASQADSRVAPTQKQRTATSSSGAERARLLSQRSTSGTAPALTAEEIVKGKLGQFVRSRREILHALARHHKLEVPAELERFFDVADTGNWDELRASYDSLMKLRQSDNCPEALPKLWAAVQETLGTAEVVHDWPAQKLLDYGEAVLGSLRPGMVYVGGTDPGRFIPTLLNETADGEHRAVLTQNALADNTYLDYVNLLYNDRLATLTQDESQRAFQDYIADAQKRYQHDKDFPDEPKQVRPGEGIQVIDGRTQISGQVAVMAINEKLFQMLMEKNPDVSFAIEQSFPLKSTYAEATPLGPIMELRVKDEQNALTPERAAQSVEQWRTVAQQLLSDPEAADSDYVRRTYAKMASEQAALLLDRNFPAEAEQNFRLAIEIHPGNPEAVFRYINLLMGQNRMQDAVSVADSAVKAAPDNRQFNELLTQLQKVRKN